MDLQLKITQICEDGTSVKLPGEIDFFPKLEFSHLNDLPDVPPECPIRDEKESGSPIKDEEKDWFIKRWIAGANFAENGEDEDIPNYPKKLFVAKWLDGQERFGVGIEEEYLEYPKKCVLHVESSVSHLYEARRLIPVFHNNHASFRLTKRFSLCKTYSSREEEFFFRKSLFSCEMFFSRFKEGVIEFCCKFCQKWHTALLVYQIMFEEESAK
eukprot:Seg1121.33 transcript_id=Seg1121.33/GoldUCD/mRNA.D3Y31 product="hypothetical protein" protein_id=Seg1121.33/GoldUCD/D3Y31